MSVRRSLRWLVLAVQVSALVSLPALAEGDRASAKTPQSYDAVVAGAGPGGLVAAMSYVARARRDHGASPRVLILETRPLPKAGADLHDPKQVDGSSLARQQVIGLKPEVIRRLRTELGFVLPNKYFMPNTSRGPPLGKGKTRAERELSTSSPATILINELQHELIQHARKMGVELRFGHAHQKSARDGSGKRRVTVEDKASGKTYEVKARTLIGADGTRSGVREGAGLKMIEGDKQGAMVGAWFRTRTPRQRYLGTSTTGLSGMLVQSGRTSYGLFALPESMAHLATAKSLTPGQKKQLYHHVARAARQVMPAAEGRKLQVTRHMGFTIQLNRAESAVSPDLSMVILGDAHQSVNPYTGSGANVAMLQGFEVGNTLSRAQRNPSRARSLWRAYDRYASSGAKTIHRMSREYAPSFGKRPPRTRTSERKAAQRLKRQRSRQRSTTRDRLSRASKRRRAASQTRLRHRDRRRAKTAIRARARGRARSRIRGR